MQTDLHAEVVRTAPLNEMARMIMRDWKPMYFGAVPYVQAMLSLENLSSKYIAEDGRTIVAYFLGNAQTWKGPVARAVKAELKRRLKECK